MTRLWSDRFFTSADGLTLYARDYPGADGRARLPVICIHGLTRNSRDFEDVAPYLAATGRRVLAVDVRGRGRSARDPDPENYRPAVYAGDVIALFDQLGVKRAVFVGTSMGGLIAMVLATLQPDLIAASVINDVGPKLSPVGLGRILSYTGKPPEVRNWKDARAYVKAINSAAFPAYRDKDWDRFARRVFDDGPNGRPVPAYDPAITVPFRTAGPDKPAPDMDPVFQALANGRPTLLTHGALSDLLDADGVELMRTLAPDLTVVDVPGVGHAPMLTEPEAKAAVALFLNDLP
jgi:pimeloyl-ACP methyl ester carboxylesterase